MTDSGDRSPGEPSSARPARPPTIFQRASGFLKTHAGHAFCAACLADVLDIRASAAHNVMPKLEGHGIFSVRHSPCSRCGRNRLVVSTQPSTS